MNIGPICNHRNLCHFEFAFAGKPAGFMAGA